MSKLTCFDVAEYFLTLQEEDADDFISNLKLQKLVYYAQGFWLALKGKKLFENDIEAWLHGPVVPELYRYYKDNGSKAIPSPISVDFSKYTEEQKDLFNEIYSVYGQYSAWKLRNMTHEEAPWKCTTLNSVISEQEMGDYFKTQLK